MQKDETNFHLCEKFSGIPFTLKMTLLLSSIEDIRLSCSLLLRGVGAVGAEVTGHPDALKYASSRLERNFQIFSSRPEFLSRDVWSAFRTNEKARNVATDQSHALN